MTCTAPRVLPRVCLCAVTALSGYAAHAVEPANIQAGPFLVVPTLDAELGYVDNLLRTEDDTKDTGSRPGLRTGSIPTP